MPPTYPRILAAPLFLLAVVAACAEGEGDPEAADPLTTGGAAGAGGGAGQAQGGAGVGGDAGASGSSGGAAAGSGGSGAALIACDPLAPAACALKCALLADGFFCDDSGAVQEGQPCGADQVGDNCAPGLVCIQKSCARFCSTTPDCQGDRTCSLVIDGPDGSEFKVCEAKVDECKPGSQTGCAAGEGCYPQTSGNKCDTPGSKAIGEECAFASDCVAGSSCFKLGGATRCFRLCDLAAPACEGEETCAKQGPDYGLCTGP